jgi:hypothetical protein
MNGILKLLVVLFLTGLTAGCRLAVIVVEGGEVQSNYGVCSNGNVCIIDGLPGENTVDFFTAVPAPGWFFHKWSSGEKFICGDSALPVCELNVGPIGDDFGLIETLRASSEIIHLMPVFKDYPRVTLGIEPRTIVTEGENQLWLQPANFQNYSYDQVVEICPDGVCSGYLPGSSVDLTGYIWASSHEFSLLGLAYQSAGVALEEDFSATFSGPGGLGVIGLLRDPPRGREELTIFGSDSGGGASVGDGGLGISRDESIALAGVWFWRPLD